MQRSQPSVIGLQSSVLLIGLTICSFLFYGVVGQDKTWLLAPLFVFSYVAITIVLLRRALGTRHQAAGGIGDPASAPRPPPSGLLWILFLVWGIAMIQHATVPFEAKLVTLFIGGVVGAYWVWGSELTTFKDNRIGLGMLIFVVMLAALYGLIVHFKCPDQVLWTERFAIYKGRLMSTYICPNHFAHLMQMLLPFCLVLLFIPQSGVYLRILSGYSFLVFLPPLYLTESRAGWLGSIAAVGVVACLMALRRSKKLFVLLVILVPLCSTLLLFAGWRFSETFQRRAKPVVAFLQQQSGDGVGSEARDFRPQTWMDTIDMIKVAPLLGHGPGNYRYVFPEYRNRFRGQRIVTGHPHNEYLELIADYGWIGFGLFALAWIYGLVWILIKSLKAQETRHAYLGFAFLAAAAGTMVHSFFDFEMHVFPNALVFVFLAAVAVGPMRAVRRRGRRPEAGGQQSVASAIPVGAEKALDHEQPATTTKQLTPKVQRLDPNQLLNGLLALGFLVGTAFCLQIMSSAFIRALGDRISNQSSGTRHLAQGTFDSAVNYYELAIKIDPQNWRAYKGLGKLHLNQRYYCLDRDEKLQWAMTELAWFKKAYQHNSHDPEIVADLGRALIFLAKNQRLMPAKQIELGLDLLREACSYRKFNDAYWWTLGVELRKAEHYGEALEVFQYAARIKRTPSIKMNIEWLEKQGAEAGGQRSEGGGQGADFQPQREKTDLLDLLNLMDN